MKLKLLILVFLFTKILSFSQQPINYKALIKDNLGNVVANQSITVRLAVLEGAIPIYIETHSPTTDSNGLVILNLGTGNVIQGNYEYIYWNRNDHFLNVQIDIGSGLTDLGTTQFLAVPYALYAQTSNSVANAPGLKAIDEGRGIGWRLEGRNPINYGNINENAVDLSVSTGSSTTRGATGLASIAGGNNTIASGDYSFVAGSSSISSGDYSLAFGKQTTASGDYSVALGEFSNASGESSTAIGRSVTASASYATAMGYRTDAIASYSTAMGYYTEANRQYSLVIGKYNDNTFSSLGDILFQVGNGTSSLRSNAFTVLANGYTTIGTHTEEPTTDFQVNHGITGTVNGFKLQNSGSNDNWWRFYTVNSTGLLYLYSKAGGDSSPVGSFNDNSGVYSALSDRRVKDNFQDLHFNWQDFMQLKPLTYHYKTDKNKQSNIGFVAQDVEPIYPELVNYNQENDLYQLNYSGFGVVAIKAIQEQQIVIEKQQKQIEELKTLLANQKQASTNHTMILQALLDRVEILETNSLDADIKLAKNKLNINK